MRVLVLGGTRFIGLALVEDLLGAGHTVGVVHRGEHEPPDLAPEVEHIHTARRDLPAHRDTIARFGPDAVVDLAAMTAADAEAALAALDPAVTLVAVSTIESYRVFDSIYAGTVTDAVPLAEDAPLREGPYPAPEQAVSQGWDYDAGSYDKLAVERLYLERGATICRLPLVYGPRDYKRREDFVLARVRAGRERIPFGPGTFLTSRGYAPELARGLRLAAERGPGGVFNLAESASPTVGLWLREILVAAGASAELVRVPEDLLPPDMGLTGEIPQPWLVDAGKAARELGWVHADWRECTRRSVRWHLEHPPPASETTVDFSADDAALAAAGR
ncbi:MAG TPA: NAD-dependent epimerase/dehydratase family protein [Solirubrobacterales bacterium]|nr:NAD-dependent epimerase/dehydratase family protein [Solirubrobacterales bacterium]